MKRSKNKLASVLTALFLCVALISSSLTISAYAATNGVITGKDGWYFITSDSTIPDYQGTDLFTPLQLEMIRQNFINMRDTLEADGIEFVVMLAPNKENIYSEYMPDEYGQLAPYTRIQQVYDLLKDEVRVVYPEEMLREAKEKYPFDLYYKTDPHWNGIGTYLCTKLLMEELGYEMPELEDVTITPYQIDNLDCSQLLGRRIPDIGYTISGYEDQGICDKHILICGDSFGAEINDCLEPVTAGTFIVHRDIYEPYMVYTTGADVLVLEVLERFLEGMPIYSVVS